MLSEVNARLILLSFCAGMIIGGSLGVNNPHKNTISAWEYRVQKCKETHIPECDVWFKKATHRNE